jgi:hypothetical protein
VRERDKRRTRALGASHVHLQTHQPSWCRNTLAHTQTRTHALALARERAAQKPNAKGGGQLPPLLRSAEQLQNTSSTMASEREALLFSAKVAEQAERYVVLRAWRARARGRREKSLASAPCPLRASLSSPLSRPAEGGDTALAPRARSIPRLRWERRGSPGEPLAGKREEPSVGRRRTRALSSPHPSRRQRKGPLGARSTRADPPRFRHAIRTPPGVPERRARALVRESRRRERERETDRQTNAPRAPMPPPTPRLLTAAQPPSTPLHTSTHSYDDMAKSMKAIAQTAGEKELTVEERNLLSVGAFLGRIAAAAPQETKTRAPPPPSPPKKTPTPHKTNPPPPHPPPNSPQLKTKQATRTSSAPAAPPGASSSRSSSRSKPRATSAASR